MRLVPRLAVPVIVLILAAAGCGGSQVTVEEVPGDPVDLSVPGTAEGLAPAAATATPTTATSVRASSARSPGQPPRG